MLLGMIILLKMSMVLRIWNTYYKCKLMYKNINLLKIYHTHMCCIHRIYTNIPNFIFQNNPFNSIIFNTRGINLLIYNIYQK